MEKKYKILWMKDQGFYLGSQTKEDEHRADAIIQGHKIKLVTKNRLGRSLVVLTPEQIVKLCGPMTLAEQRAFFESV